MIPYDLIITLMNQLYQLGFVDSGFSKEDVETWVKAIPKLTASDIVVAKLPTEIVFTKLAISFITEELAESEDAKSQQQLIAEHFLVAAEALNCAAASVHLGTDIFHGEKDYEICQSNDGDYYLVEIKNLILDNHSIN